MVIEKSEFLLANQAVAYGSVMDLLLSVRKTRSFEAEDSRPCTGRVHDSVALYLYRQ